MKQNANRRGGKAIPLFGYIASITSYWMMAGLLGEKIKKEGKGRRTELQ